MTPNPERQAPMAGEAPDTGMVWIPGGTFRMGSENFYPEERPVHDVTLDGMDLGTDDDNC